MHSSQTVADVRNQDMQEQVSRECLHVKERLVEAEREQRMLERMLTEAHSRIAVLQDRTDPVIIKYQGILKQAVEEVNRKNASMSVLRKEIMNLQEQLDASTGLVYDLRQHLQPQPAAELDDIAYARMWRQCGTQGPDHPEDTTWDFATLLTAIHADD